MDKKKIIQYFKGDELAADVFMSKYRINDESPPDMFGRLVNEIYRIEKKYWQGTRSYGSFYELLNNFKYMILGGSNMFGIGNSEQLSSLGNCFVIPSPEDSYGGIMKTDQELVQIMKRRGGVGVDVSTLRPEGTPVNNAAKTTTGAVSFCDRFSRTTGEVAQNGRRGALMLSMSCEHPEATKFIKSKVNLNAINNANISIRASDKFMEDAINDVEGENLDMFNLIAESAWKSAEPGLLFWDRIVKESPADVYTKTISTNPCGEVPLSEYDSCRLASMNLPSFVDDRFKPTASFNFKKYHEAVTLAQRVMDNIIDLEEEKINAIINKIKNKDSESLLSKEVELNLWNNVLQVALDYRRTGLGMTGLADVFAFLNIKYDSDEAIKLAEEIAKTHAIASYESSIELAMERGPFRKCWPLRERDSVFVQRMLGLISEEHVKLYEQYGRRNVATMAIAPNGSISIVAQVSSGIEPIFMPYYKRRRKTETGEFQEYFVIHEPLKTYFNEVLHKDITPNMQAKEIDKLFKMSPYYNSDAHTIDPIRKTKLQGAIQQYIDHSISVTYNLPNDATIEDVKRLYKAAYLNGCKGCTIYRDGSRVGILESAIETFKPTDAVKRPPTLKAKIHRVMYKRERYLVIIGFLDNNPYEVFAIKEPLMLGLFPGDVFDGEIVKEKTKKKRWTLIFDTQEDEYIGKGTFSIPDFTGLYEDSYQEFITRSISTSLRHGADISYIYEQINNIKKANMSDFEIILSTVFKQYINGNKIRIKEDCPECGGKLVMQEGCVKCMSCGYSRC